MKSKARGVTLIELVIVLVVVAILAAIAIPNYREYVLRSHRTEAKAALLNVAAAQEKFYLQNNTYTSDLSAAPPAGLGIPATTENGYYTIAITAGANTTSFTATATATGPQTQDSRCASFSINQAGSKTATNTDCWE